MDTMDNKTFLPKITKKAKDVFRSYKNYLNYVNNDKILKEWRINRVKLN